MGAKLQPADRMTFFAVHRRVFSLAGFVLDQELRDKVFEVRSLAAKAFALLDTDAPAASRLADSALLNGLDSATDAIAERIRTLYLATVTTP